MVSRSRLHPHMLEINIRNWIWRLQRKYDRVLSLGTIPEQEWDNFKELGFDYIWLMGLWKNSPRGRLTKSFSPDLQREYSRALPGWTREDITGSPYSIHDYSVHPTLGTNDDLAYIHAALTARDMRLITDFVPNHLAFDHPWVISNPDYFIFADQEALQDKPDYFFTIQQNGKIYALAHGRDPNFSPWTDTVQLNYFNPATRTKMKEELLKISQFCDGVRCDMAMLCLNDIHYHTWGWLLEKLGYGLPETEFWADAVKAVQSKNADFTFIAEVYWGLEWNLQQLGFQYTYDKTLYDRLCDATPEQIRGHLMADAEYQKRSLRFIDNHDEDSAIQVFGPERATAAAVLISTIPGMRFFFEPQLSGKKIRLPLQLSHSLEDEDPREMLPVLSQILKLTDKPLFHQGAWRLLQLTPTWAGCATHQNILAWEWLHGSQHFVVAINWSAAVAQGRLMLSPRSFGDRNLVLFDHLNGLYYTGLGKEIDELGLFVELSPQQCHILEIHVKSSEDDDSINIVL